MLTESLKLRPATIEAYRAEAGKRGLGHTVLMREVLEAYVEQRRVRRLAMPPVVPEVNREAWMELRSVASDLHRIARALEASRTDSLVSAAEQAARSSAWAVKMISKAEGALPEIHRLLGKAKAEPDEIERAIRDAVRDAQDLNAAVHDHLRHLPEQISPALLERAQVHVHRTMDVVRALGSALLGTRNGGSGS